MTSEPADWWGDWDDGGVADGFGAMLAERMERLTEEVWLRDRAAIRSWTAGNPLMPMVALAGRRIEDVCAGL